MALKPDPARPPKPTEAIAMTGRTIISTDHAPSLDAPLSQGVRRGPLVQVSGQLPYDPGTGTVVGATVAEQTTQALRNVAAVLDAARATLDDVVMFRVYLTDPADLAAMNDAYAAFVGTPFPARTTVYMTLPPGVLVEIDALAVPAA
ncbi:Rid family hydrolase [Actinomadura nitritigenes]